MPPAEDPPAPTSEHGLDDLYDIGRLADRLGVEHATIRVWLSRNVPWLPRPDGRLNGGAVWRATTLEGIEDRRAKGRPGRKPKFVPDPAAAHVARTGPVPTAAIPVVTPAATAGTLPAAAATTGAAPVEPGALAAAPAEPAALAAAPGLAAAPAATAPADAPVTPVEAPGPLALL